MRTPVLVALLLMSTLNATVVLDRIAAIAGKHVIKSSDIDKEVRVTDFLNGAKLDFSPAARKKAADRLIDQDLIRNEIQVGGYETPTQDDVDKLLADVKRQRFKSDAQYNAALREYGVSEALLRSHLLWQLSVIHFIDERFRPGVLVTDQDIQDYYQKHRQELTAQYKTSDLQALREHIESQIEGERINEQFFAWLDQQRKDTHIEYRQDALK